MRPPSPEMTCGFLIQLVFCKKQKTVWFIGIEASKRRVHPLLKKILDPPLSYHGNVLSLPSLSASLVLQYGSHLYHVSN